MFLIPTSRTPSVQTRFSVARLKIDHFHLILPAKPLRDKMETGIWANFHWENGIWVTGIGNHRQDNNGTGTGILKIWESNLPGNGIWAKFGLRKWDLYPLPFKILLQKPFHTTNLLYEYSLSK